MSKEDIDKLLSISQSMEHTNRELMRTNKKLKNFLQWAIGVFAVVILVGFFSGVKTGTSNEIDIRNLTKVVEGISVIVSSNSDFIDSQDERNKDYDELVKIKDEFIDNYTNKFMLELTDRSGATQKRVEMSNYYKNDIIKNMIDSIKKNNL